MTAHAALEGLVFLGLLTLVALPLGAHMARVYAGEAHLCARLLGPVERGFYRLAGVPCDEEMTWRRYAAAVLLFNLLGTLVVYALQRLQGSLPLDPSGLGGVAPEVAFNTAVSFATNTNWQAYAGETTQGPLVQMVGLTVQNFVSAATGMAVLVAFVRGLTRQRSATLGSFWVDLTRSTLFILLPLSALLALLLVSQGVVQTLSSSVSTHLLQHPEGGLGEQLLAVGPAASQVAIKQLGTNGGGFFNANSAHPFENPTALSNLLQLVAILLVPAALCFTFGALVKDVRQGRALLAAMVLLFVPALVVTTVAEQAGTPVLTAQGLDLAPSTLQSGGNMEGKETRFGVTESALFATATTAASNGSVNAMHDSFTPLGGLAPMVLMLLGEVVFGGVGSGLYGLLMYVLIAVFVAGLLVGRTPEYLGKKIEAFEMKMAMLVFLLPAAAVLVGSAIACVTPAGTEALGNPGIHGFSEILYAFSSTANNNGSAFAGLTASGRFYTLALGVCMMVGRYGVIVPVLAAAGALAKKGPVARSAGTLPTHTPLFVGLLVGTIVLLGALTFFPALALGPVAEHLTLSGHGKVGSP